MTPDEYEQIAREIARSIFEHVEGVTPDKVGCGRKNRPPGISGYRHQIDVSVRGLQDLILIECKCWKKKVSVEAVLTFFGRIHDIAPTFSGQIHGVMVTTKGFQPGVELLAKYYKIDLQIVRGPDEFSFAY